MTIHDLEEAVQNGLEALRVATLNPDADSAKELLLPEGLSPVVELVHGENMRKKRSSAAAWNWNPLIDKVVISFRPQFIAPSNKPLLTQIDEAAKPALSPSPAPDVESEDRQNTQPFVGTITRDSPAGTDSVFSPVAPQEIIECCQALAQAEKSNRQFIAIKWFRDELLATVGYSWAQTPQRRQLVLSQAIAMGRIDLKKIPNPKSPSYPTTAISLNRAVPIPGITSRFNPVPIRGEAGSATLIADRGSF